MTNTEPPEAYVRPDQETLCAILRHNLGFGQPDCWIESAQPNNFAFVTASSVPRCPDCSAAADRTRGQYAYYSTLIHLRECGNCSLVWSDVALDPSIVQQHFPVAYRDDDYFQDARRPIFEHLVTVISGLAPPGVRVLDVGGA